MTLLVFLPKQENANYKIDWTVFVFFNEVNLKEIFQMDFIFQNFIYKNSKNPNLF